MSCRTKNQVAERQDHDGSMPPVLDPPDGQSRTSAPVAEFPNGTKVPPGVWARGRAAAAPAWMARRSSSRLMDVDTGASYGSYGLSRNGGYRSVTRVKE